MGAELSCREDRLPPLRDRRRAAARHRVRAAGRQRPGQVLPALRRPAGRRARPGSSSRCRAATTASACSPRPAPTVAPATATRVVDRSPAERLEPGEIAVPADISSAAFFVVAGAAGRRQRGGPRARSASTRPGPACSRSSSGWGREIEVEPERRAGRRADRRACGSALGAAAGDRGRRRRGAAGDRRAAAGRARRLLRRGHDDDPRRGRAAAQGVRPDRDRQPPP